MVNSEAIRGCLFLLRDYYKGLDKVLPLETFQELQLVKKPLRQWGSCWGNYLETTEHLPYRSYTGGS